jgi:ABC-type transport system substrate-binding protein
MKKLFSLFFAISLTLSACGTASTQSAQTGTPTATPAVTQTPTSTITPLLTIPTFTPTFDISSIVTVTPAQEAVCPIVNGNVSKNSLFPENGEPYKKEYINSIIDTLNLGTSIEFISDELKKKINGVLDMEE